LPPEQVRGKRLTLTLPHRQHILSCTIENRLHLGPRGGPAPLAFAVRLQREDVGVARHERQVRVALQVELLLQFLKRRHHLPRARDVHYYCPRGLRGLEPPGGHRHVAPVEQLAQVLPDLVVRPRQLEREPELRIVVTVVDGADLDPQPPALNRPFGQAEARHAARHSL